MHHEIYSWGSNKGWGRIKRGGGEGNPQNSCKGGPLIKGGSNF